MTTPERANAVGAAWLLADMVLVTASLAIVKAVGLDYPAAQLVVLRAATGFVLILPWILVDRHAFRGLDRLPLQALRVVLSATALTLSFYAIARVPLALFTAIGFTRPLVTMALVAWLIGEPIGRRRWIAATVALVGVVIAVNPTATAPSAGLFALIGVVLAGSSAVVVTRQLTGTPLVVLMAAYTAGLTLLLTPLAALVWVPVPRADLPVLLAIGLCAQVGQLCFLRAHALAAAGVLSVLGYLSLILSTLVGVVVFAEIPTLGFAVGAALVIAAVAWANLRP